MLGLAVYAERNGNDVTRQAALKAAEVFLSRRLFKRRTDGSVMSVHFLRPKFPRYWHYDILGGLVAMAEMGLIRDPRCANALAVLERKELPEGGWAAEGQFYKVSPGVETSNRFGSLSPVAWSGNRGCRLNQWVTTHALYMLRAAGR